MMVIAAPAPTTKPISKKKVVPRKWSNAQPTPPQTKSPDSRYPKIDQSAFSSLFMERSLAADYFPGNGR